MPSVPTSSFSPPSGPGRLHTGHQRMLWLDEGTEIRCLQGTLRLRPAWVAQGELPLLGDRKLHAPCAWRSDRGQWLQLAALRPALYRLDAQPASALAAMTDTVRPPKENHPEPQGAGWLMEHAAGWLRRAAIYLRRGQRAA